MIREGFKYKNQISEGYIVRKPEKDTIFHSWISVLDVLWLKQGKS